MLLPSPSSAGSFPLASTQELVPMAASVPSFLASISALSPSYNPRPRSSSNYAEFSCASTVALSERHWSYHNAGAVCSVFPVSSKRINLRWSTFARGRELDQFFNSQTCETLPQIQNSLRHLQRPSQVKSEAEWNLGSEGMTLDEETLQQDLDMAVKEENYTLAAKLRDDLRLLHEDSEAAVLAANSRFYNAFRNGDLVGMRSIWAKGDNICCVHPGAGTISGYDLVIDSWEVVCGADHEFPIKIELKDVEVYVKGDVGYVTCLEVIKTKGSSWGKQVATNVFERADGRWYICAHHASHVDL